MKTILMFTKICFDWSKSNLISITISNQKWASTCIRVNFHLSYDELVGRIDWLSTDTEVGIHPSENFVVGSRAGPYFLTTVV